MLLKSPPVLDLFRKAGSGPPLGTEEDKNGDTLGLLVGFLDKASNDSDELVPSAPDALSRRAWWTVLLLRRLKSDLSSCRFLEKKELLDAVMGVVGVFAVIRDGGGLKFLSGPF